MWNRTFSLVISKKILLCLHIHIESLTVQTKTKTTLIQEGGSLPSVPGSPSEWSLYFPDSPVAMETSKISVYGGVAPSWTTTLGA